MAIITRREAPEVFAINTGKSSWEWLEDTCPLDATSVLAFVEAGWSPEDIYRHVRVELGENRQALALRYRQAAFYLMRRAANGEGA